MSWLSKILPPKIKSDGNKSNIPEGLWCKCEKCNEILYCTDLNNNQKVCPKCNHHHRVSARDRINFLLDEENRQELFTNIKPKDILKFVDRVSYEDKLKNTQEKLKEDDALICFTGSINSVKVVVVCFEFNFIGGSMGSVVGEKFTRGVKYAVDNNLPFISIASSGGARMQEGVTSLMQMAKTCAALTLLHNKQLPYISILTNPTMGGVSASFAFIGDIVIAEPNAMIGFAGARVIEQTVREKLPEGFQLSEFLVTKGAIDFICERTKLKAKLTDVLKLLLNQ
jgi:acetyl-CoA carboxylase carboxyl transferase subunit beta